jgi:hypothetical protein
VNPDVVKAAYGPTQGGEQVRVDLHRVHEICPLGEKDRQESAPGADLEDHILRHHAGDYYACCVRVFEKVLTEAFFREIGGGVQRGSSDLERQAEEAAGVTGG